MIYIKEKKDCCGCFACLQKCPKQCIHFYEDNEGFLYPKVDTEKCVDCGLCEEVCPSLNMANEREPLGVYAAKNPDNYIRNDSSSGGIFTLLAEQIIDQGGVVFGVRWNEHFEAVHTYTDTKEGLSSFRGSKYVQSFPGDTFKQAENFLKDGRKVLYSGTSCQIAGLRSFLRKDYHNLYTVDLICHGCPSPGVFRWYLNDELARESSRQSGKRIQYHSSLPISSIAQADVLARKYGFEIGDINFRDKRLGWKIFSFVLYLKPLTELTAKGWYPVVLTSTLYENSFMKGFLNNIYLRPSCYVCPSKAGKSESDLTLADYWGIQSIIPELDDDKGISAITVNTSKGYELLLATSAELFPTNYANLCANNPSLLYSCKLPYARDRFFSLMNKRFDKNLENSFKISLALKLKMHIYGFYVKIRRVINRCFNSNI